MFFPLCVPSVNESLNNISCEKQVPEEKKIKSRLFCKHSSKLSVIIIAIASLPQGNRKQKDLMLKTVIIVYFETNASHIK